MKKVIRLGALVLAGVVVAWWLVTGAHRGWTKTSVPKTTLDPVTGIEAIEYEQRFVPGLDFLAAGLLGAGLLAGASLIGKQRNSRT